MQEDQLAGPRIFPQPIELLVNPVFENKAVTTMWPVSWSPLNVLTWAWHPALARCVLRTPRVLFRVLHHRLVFKPHQPRKALCYEPSRLPPFNSVVRLHVPCVLQPRPFRHCRFWNHNEISPGHSRIGPPHTSRTDQFLSRFLFVPFLCFLPFPSTANVIRPRRGCNALMACWLFFSRTKLVPHGPQRFTLLCDEKSQTVGETPHGEGRDGLTPEHNVVEQSDDTYLIVCSMRAVFYGA
ncbi:LADA_0A08922g1_1 [Lachancea dasiensis]|uniref:LADA_0A08922g1_1 n=1 Tax=Lachancea dasiensis TaxID=1072105 RepID=A0A1G4IQU6_9SACH|nr:LADA_0A08922g1_1 [Lachancea dasiensis]